MGRRHQQRAILLLLGILWLIWIRSRSSSEIGIIIPHQNQSSPPNGSKAPVSELDPYKAVFENSTLLSRIRKYHLTPPANRNVLYNLTNDSTSDHPDHSKFHDLLMRIVLRKQHRARNVTSGGFFIEAGAADGQYLSHTLDLERFHGWSGLLVEASPKLVPQLKSKRRRSWIADVCLTDQVYLKAKHISLPRNQMSNFMIRGMGLLAQAGIQNIGDNVHFEKDLECFSLYSLVKAVNDSKVKVVDLLVLDVEGREFKILEGYPFSLLPIMVIAVDHSHWPSLKRLDFPKIMKHRGYQLEYASKTNMIFTLK